MKWIQLIVPAVLTSALTACEGRSQTAWLPVGLQQRAGQRASAIATSGGGAEVTSTSTSPRGPHTTLPHTQAVLSGVRGGAIDRKLVAATAGASILTLYGAACALSPDEVIKGYGIPPVPVITHLTLNSAVLSCTATFLIWCLAYTKTSVNRAVGIAVIPYVLRSLQNILTQAPAKFGSSAVTEYIGLALSSLVAYATWTNAAYADNAMKGFGLGMLLHGLILFCAPYTTLATQDEGNKGNPQEPDIMTLFSRNYGNNLMINGVFFTALAMGYDIFKAFAFCWFSGGTGMGAMTFVTKDIPTYAPEAVGPTIAWLVICYTIASLMMS